MYFLRIFTCYIWSYQPRSLSAVHFITYFNHRSYGSESQKTELRLDYLKMRLDYVGDPPLNSYKVDAELIESVYC